MFGINGGELLILIVVAIIVVGPERMPEYAKQLREWVVGVRTMVDRGRDQLKEEVGDEVDWSQLDPRQYDPRRIVREAFNEPTQSGGATSVSASTATSTTPMTAGAAGAAVTSATSTADPVDAPAHQPHPPSSGAPFDSEAT